MNDELFLRRLGYELFAGYGGYSVYLNGDLVFNASAFDLPRMKRSVENKQKERYHKLALEQAKIHFEMFREKLAREFWEKFGEVPCDDEGLIQEPFLGFIEGTDREEIMKWIEDKFEIAIYDLMFPGDRELQPDDAY